MYAETKGSCFLCGTYSLQCLCWLNMADEDELRTSLLVIRGMSVYPYLWFTPEHQAVISDLTLCDASTSSH